MYVAAQMLDVVTVHWSSESKVLSRSDRSVDMAFSKPVFEKLTRNFVRKIPVRLAQFFASIHIHLRFICTHNSDAFTLFCRGIVDQMD
jgi:hypothetical protein